ncbi:transcription initiation factor TFIID subunit A-domain-containing protein [Coniella lustricola]|uniref:Transcription initiation factor TFIID subunit A-domain-containing protein n=1 Tax=Coniella lustricola TaxID=2025994 RepID=A0A2T3A1C7_9PEZI|nr:transcription initiation factor TFIID subunit A-domain-containing protein [Coniella lustricola]
MNPAGQPATTSQPSQPAAAPGQQPRKLFRPDDMDNLPLADTEKLRYKNGLRGLWNVLQNSARGSQQHLEAQKKIHDFSLQLMNKLKSSGVRPPVPTAQSAQGTQSSPTVQPTPTPNPAASAASPTAPPGGQPAQNPTPSGSIATPVPNPQPNAAPLSAQIQNSIRQHLAQMTFIAPQTTVDQGQEAVAAWTKLSRDKYTRALYTLSQAGERIKEIDSLMKQLQAKAPNLTAEEQKKLQDLAQSKTKSHEQHAGAKRFLEQFRKEQTTFKEAKAQAANGGQDVAANQTNRTGAAPQQSGPNTGIQQALSGADAAKAPQAAGPGRVPPVAAQAGQSQPQSAPQASAVPVQASPVATAPPVSNPAGQIKVDTTMGNQPPPPPPPPVNTAIAAASVAGIPSAGTPTQAARPPLMPTATPGSAVPRSLSHTAAVQYANQTRNSQPSMTNQAPQQGTPQGPGGTPTSAGVIGSAQPGHLHAHPTQQPQQTLSQKLPIPKHLPEKAAMPPQPVATNIGGIAPGRPTYTQGGGTTGGVMGQPVLPRIPVVQFEGEGERVMNRKKLDELVRQVCGGQAEGQEGNMLTPEVEESVLNLADSFVDRVIHSACTLAKQRGSKVLEIRDIQLVLERGYNIRIPGYSSDELRTVRKVQPAQGWITKMSAIQASKVTGSRDL